MAAERLDMRCVRDVLRLHFVCKQSPRAIARSGACGRTTAQEYIARANNNNLIDYDSVEKLSDEELARRLGFKSHTQSTWQSDRKVMPDWQIGRAHV